MCCVGSNCFKWNDLFCKLLLQKQNEILMHETSDWFATVYQNSTSWHNVAFIGWQVVSCTWQTVLCSWQPLDIGATYYVFTVFLKQNVTSHAIYTIFKIFICGGTSSNIRSKILVQRRCAIWGGISSDIRVSTLVGRYVLYTNTRRDVSILTFSLDRTFHPFHTNHVPYMRCLTKYWISVCGTLLLRYIM